MHRGTRFRLRVDLVLALAIGAAVVAIVAMRGHGVSATVPTAKAPLAYDSTRATDADRGAAKATRDATPTHLRRAADLPDGDVPLSAAIGTLLPLANSGRADAMRELAQRLMTCLAPDDHDDAALRRIQLRRFYWYHGHEPATDAEVAQVASAIDAASRRRADCAGVDPTLVSQRVEWLQKAAQAGDPEALLDYAAEALQRMGRDDILKDPEGVERRRKLAGNFLNEALARGDCDALWKLAQAYSGETGRMDWIYPPDLNQAYAYAVANLQWVERHGGSTDFSEAQVDRIGAQLSSAQRVALSRQGEQLFQSRCSN